MMNEYIAAANYISEQKRLGKRVVLVTGCFDLLHIGHLHFLKQAKAAGDILVVGVEDDNRVNAFKGSSRPTNPISERVELLQALAYVDFAFTIQGSPTEPLGEFYSSLHSVLRPDILVVSDNDPHLENRRRQIESAGGRLAIVGNLNVQMPSRILQGGAKPDNL